MNDPILYLGLDIATKRDTTALAGVYYNRPADQYCLWGHRIWQPPVDIPKQVMPTILNLLNTFRVGRLAFDPFQFISESQRLANMGFEHLLREVNQSSESTAFSNVLQEMVASRRYLGYKDAQRRNHYSWCVAETKERGFVIKKARQTKQIDCVIAEAMALYVCVEDLQSHHHPTYDEDTHARSIYALL